MDNTLSTFEENIFKYYKKGIFSEKVTKQLDIIFSGKQFNVRKTSDNTYFNECFIYEKGFITECNEGYFSVSSQHLLNKVLLGEFYVE